MSVQGRYFVVVVGWFMPALCSITADWLAGLGRVVLGGGGPLASWAGLEGGCPFRRSSPLITTSLLGHVRGRGSGLPLTSRQPYTGRLYTL